MIQSNRYHKCLYSLYNNYLYILNRNHWYTMIYKSLCTLLNTMSCNRPCMRKNMN